MYLDNAASFEDLSCLCCQNPILEVKYCFKLSYCIWQIEKIRIILNIVRFSSVCGLHDIRMI